MELMSIHTVKNKALKKNKKGGIEGLPLQLMIIIIIATLATSILVGWMGNIETPNSIGEVTVDSGEATVRTSNGSQYIDECVTVTVLDQNGNPLADATVVLTGLGITDSEGRTAFSTTDSNGQATFDGLKLKINGHVGFIDVLASKAGYGEDTSCRITVIA